MKRPLTVAVALALLAGSVATAQADNHGQRGDQHGSQRGQAHGQSRSQWNGPSHNFSRSRGGDNLHRNGSPNRDMRHGGRNDWNNGSHRRWNNDSRGNWNDGRSRHWDGRRSFGNVHFDNHRFVDRHDRFFHGHGFHDRGFRGDGRIRFRSGPYFRPHGYRAYAWHRGDYLPVAYYAPRYVIHDYRTYRLGPPPRGHHWVRVDNDVVLAAITTGIVLSVVNDIF